MDLDTRPKFARIVRINLYVIRFMTKILYCLGSSKLDTEENDKMKKYLTIATKYNVSCSNIIIYHSVAVNTNYTIATYNLGYYYQRIEIDHDQMKKYYLIAINNNCVHAMHHLGYHYQHIEKDYSQMKKYYLMAIDNNYVNAMNELGYYYRKIEKNYDEMKKYYLMAIDHNDDKAMYKLGCYYYTTEKDYDKMEKYYLMAINSNNIDAMTALGHYYQNIKKDYDKMKKYYSMAIKYSNDKSIKNKILNAIYSLDVGIVIDICKENKIKPMRFKNRINEYILLKELDYDTKKLMTHRNVCFFVNRMKCAENNNEQCPICFEYNKLVYLECMAHMVCIYCYESCISKKICPICRFNVNY